MGITPTTRLFVYTTLLSGIKHPARTRTHAGGMRRALRSMTLLLLVPRAAGFVPGAVCNGVDLSSDSSVLLRGKHLRVHELSWYPFAFKDKDAPSGWNGFDIDLLDEVAALLGFTYEVHEASQLPSETRWTETLIRTVNDVDLWASWWQRDEERMNHTVMLNGHIDASPTLVRPPLQASGTGGSLIKSFTTFILPFSYDLWGCIILMVLLSGLVDWVIERKNGGTIKGSLYEYCSGVLWGGFQDPMNAVSAVYQVFNAFIILVVVSAYTANLASILVLARTPTPTFRSLDDLISSRTSVCSVSDYPSQTTYETTYPDMLFTKFKGHSPIADGLNGRGGTTCLAALGPRIDYDTWRTDGANCGLATVGPSLFLASAGWVTNKQGEACIQRAVDYAIHSLQARGRTNAIFSKWLPVRGCGEAAPSQSAPASNPTTGRRLEGDSVSHPAGRRLQEDSGGGGDGGVEGQLALLDFFGLFAMWIAITAGSLIWHAVTVYWPKGQDRARPVDSPAKGVAVADIDYVPEAFPKDVDITSTQAMLRHVVLELNKMSAASNVKVDPWADRSSNALMDEIKFSHMQSSAKIAKVEEALRKLQAPILEWTSGVSPRSGRQVRSRSMRSSSSESSLSTQMASLNSQMDQITEGVEAAPAPARRASSDGSKRVRRVQSFTCGTPTSSSVA